MFAIRKVVKVGEHPEYVQDPYVVIVDSREEAESLIAETGKENPTILTSPDGVSVTIHFEIYEWNPNAWEIMRFRNHIIKEVRDEYDPREKYIPEYK